MVSYYNEIDPYAAQWLRNLIANKLIADGDVDERSICDVAAADLHGYTQCHFFRSHYQHYWWLWAILKNLEFQPHRRWGSDWFR